MTPLPDAPDAQCLCPRCLDEVQMLTDREAIRMQVREHLHRIEGNRPARTAA
ncbi:MAG: hypothetical protein KGL63_09990 [Betaproteobacteria bacterium]|nr:hypothetical protein [Betaproteobacteria bacterium]